MTKLRGYITLTVVCLALLLFDPVQRFVVVPWIRLVPSHRVAVMIRWQRFLAALILRALGTLGGARMPPLLTIDGEEGVLILMNHQSVLDIPLLVASVHHRYPRMVTRKRYQRWIPLISHMVRLYQYPVVDPRANAQDTRKMLASIRDAARHSDVPLAIFPEGTRTKDGDIGAFRPTGLKLILKQRSWTVYVLVADGFWQRAKLKDFLEGLNTIDGKLTMRGPFAWDDPRADPEPFMAEMRGHMVQALQDLRTDEQA